MKSGFVDKEIIDQPLVDNSGINKLISYLFSILKILKLDNNHDSEKI